MENQMVHTLINPQNGNLAFKIFAFEDGCYFDHIQRNNYYSLIWFHQGNGTVRADFYEYEFAAGSLFAFSPYQPFMISSGEQISGIALQFNPDFFCIHKHQTEVACNGILFNNIYNPPFVTIDEGTSLKLSTLIEQMKAEIQNPALAQYELLISYLKIFLIALCRLKTEQEPSAFQTAADLKEPFILQNLKEAI